MLYGSTTFCRFDLHKLAQLDFSFDSFFDRRFDEVSFAVKKFLVAPRGCCV